MCFVELSVLLLLHVLGSVDFVAYSVFVDSSYYATIILSF